MANCMVHHTGKPRKGWLRFARRRNGEEAKGRPSHIGRTVLSQMAAVTDDLSQYIIRNAVKAQVRSSKIKRMFVSGVVGVKRRDNEKIISISFAENVMEFRDQRFPLRCKTSANFSILK